MLRHNTPYQLNPPERESFHDGLHLFQKPFLKLMKCFPEVQLLGFESNCPSRIGDTENRLIVGRL